MNIKVWPFLVSRNTYLDYRTVVAPDFICDTKIPNLLARVAEGELTEPGKGFIRQVIGSKAGDFTIAFRVIKATERDINLTGTNNILKDQFGREIYIYEGIVSKGIIVAKEIRESFNISELDFQEVHQQLTAKYEKFWGLVDSAPVIPSQQFSFDMGNVTSPIILEQLEPFVLTPKPSTPVLEDFDTDKNSGSRKILITFLLLALMVFIGIFFTKVLVGRTITLGCATTLEKKIEFTNGDKIAERLKKLKNEYSKKASIYLSGSLKIESSNKIRNKSLSPENKPTIKIFKDNELNLEYHPIDLAINDLKNQKVDDQSKIDIKSRIIDTSGCK